jgi:hypothetical protein
MRKEDLLRPVPIPMHSGDLPRRVWLDIIKEAGLTQEEFLGLLREK